MIKAKVAGNKDGKVTLSLEDGQVLSIPESEVAGVIKEGDSINILFASPGAEAQASTQLAKNLLNELINNS